jgi:RNA polymerase sigma-70 factor, ECF subfamily
MSVVKPACQPSSEDEFHALFAAGYRRLARLLYRVTGDCARAEEVASEAFWRLYSKPPARDSNLEGWLYRTGLRLALDQLKKERRRAAYEALAAVFGLAASPHQVLERNEERHRIRQVFAALKSERAALLLLRAEGLSYAEMASALRLNPASVGTLLARAEEAFRKEYIRRYGPPGK